MSGAVAHDERDRKGRVETTKVKRYRPGYVPEWMTKDEEDGLVLRKEKDVEHKTSVVERGTVRRTAITAPVIVKKTEEDPRLARLEASQEARHLERRRRNRWETHSSDKEEDEFIERERRRIHVPQIVSNRDVQRASDSEEEERSELEPGSLVGHRHDREYIHLPKTDTKLSVPEEDGSVPRKKEAGMEPEEEAEDDIAARRAAMKARILEKAQEEEEQNRLLKTSRDKENESFEAVSTEEEEESEEESSSEYEDSSDEEMAFRPLAKPVFVPRGVRETVAEKEAQEAEQEAEIRKKQERLEQRRLETKEIVAQRLAEEEAQILEQAAGPQGIDDIVTDEDEIDEEAEYAAWKQRELARLARDKEEKETREREEKEKAHWKSLTEEERMAALAARGDLDARKKTEKPSKKMNFLQKYYHRGAFFQTEASYKGESTPLADIAVERDFSAPTGQDRFDKSALPRVMQVR